MAKHTSLKNDKQPEKKDDSQVKIAVITGIVAIITVIVTVIGGPVILKLLDRTPMPSDSGITSTVLQPSVTISTMSPPVTATSIITFTQLVTPTSTPSSAISIGMIEIPDYKYSDILKRLRRLGFSAKSFGPYSQYDEFTKYDVIYLPAGWGWYSEAIDSLAPQYLRFVEEGRGLVVEQPNNKLRQYSPSVLPCPITIEQGQIDPNEWPPKLVGSHYLTDGISPSDLPGSDNTVTYTTPGCYTTLLISNISNYPTLLIYEYEGGGRIIFYSSTASESIDLKHQVGDEFLSRVFKWAAGRDTP